MLRILGGRGKSGGFAAAEGGAESGPRSAEGLPVPVRQHAQLRGH